MQYTKLGNSSATASRIIVGCMRIADKPVQTVARLLETALELGVNCFDHADIYGGGASEEIFAEARKLAGIPREKLFLQSKCGIRQGWYDLSRRHILDSVDGILKRLQTDYLDALLLHRPDALLEPEEVAEAFAALQAAGKVRFFGVSNCNAMQIALLQSALDQKLLLNQMQLSVAHCGMIRAGLCVNVEDESAISRDGDVLTYCRLNGLTLQAWSPFQYGMFAGSFLGSEKFPALNQTLAELAARYQATPAAVAAQWILRHPAKMQLITGTSNAEHLREICRSTEFEITAREWYEIYLSAGNQLL